MWRMMSVWVTRAQLLRWLLGKASLRVVWLARYALVWLALLSSPGCYWLQLAAPTHDGSAADADNTEPVVSFDGRYVAFWSFSDNLVPGDDNGKSDVFVYDNQTGVTSIVSIASDGSASNAHSHGYHPAISADGRYVAFGSQASNLVENDTNGVGDVFVRDRLLGETSLVSVGFDGTGVDRGSFDPDISADGRYVAFASHAKNLVDDGLSTSSRGIFVYDRVEKTTRRACISSEGALAAGHCNAPTLSADGRNVAFYTEANNLVAADNKRRNQVYVHDLVTRQTSRVSVSTSGDAGDGFSFDPSLSEDGRFVAFVSQARNLGPVADGFQNNVFVHDRLLGETELVSMATDGSVGRVGSNAPSISDDGRYVAFLSGADELSEFPTSNQSLLYLRDRATSTTTLASRTLGGLPASANIAHVALSGDGHYVVFDTQSDNLVPGVNTDFRSLYTSVAREIRVASVTPRLLPIGATTRVTISGTGFSPRLMKARFSAGSISNLVVIDESTLALDITVPNGAARGTQALYVGRAGRAAGPFSGAGFLCADCFTVF